jgi:hypothetical protein
MPFPARFDRDHLGRRWGGDAADRSDDVELLVSLTAPGGRTRWTAIAGSSGRSARERWRTDPEEGGPQDDQCDQTAHMYADSSGLMHTQVREPTDSASRGAKSTVGRATRHSFARAKRPAAIRCRWRHQMDGLTAMIRYPLMRSAVLLTCPSGRRTPAPGWRTCMSANCTSIQTLSVRSKRSWKPARSPYNVCIQSSFYLLIRGRGTLSICARLRRR